MDHTRPLRRHPARATLAASALCALGALGCASAAQRIYVAPSAENVVAGVEEGRGPNPSQSIWVENRSTEPVTVYSVTLRSCENVRQPCEPRPMDLRLAAGQRRTVLRVQPRLENRGFSFGFSFAWRPTETAAR